MLRQIMRSDKAAAPTQKLSWPTRISLWAQAMLVVGIIIWWWAPAMRGSARVGDSLSNGWILVLIACCIWILRKGVARR